METGEDLGGVRFLARGDDLGLAGAALLPSPPTRAASVDQEALAPETASALDRAEVEFSQRPQLYYNRQRQLRRQLSHDLQRREAGNINYRLEQLRLKERGLQLDGVVDKE